MSSPETPRTQPYPHTSMQYQQYSSPPPTTFALQPCDITNIVMQLMVVIHEELRGTIKFMIKQEIDSAVKDAFQEYTLELDNLRQENKLRDDLDSLKHYGKRHKLMRFSGIKENPSENTTAIVTDIVKSIDNDFDDGDIIISHRVDNPVRKDRFGRPLPPRQIIVRVKRPDDQKTYS